MSVESSRSQPPVSVLSLEDDPIFQDGLGYLVEDAGMAFHGTTNKADFLERVSVIRPTVTINDLRIEDHDRDGTSGMSVLPEIIVRSPTTRRIVLTGYPSPANLQRVLTYQVEGFLKKSRTSSPEVIAAINRVAAGGHAYDPDLMTELLRRPVNLGADSSPIAHLTAREADVLRLVLVKGWGNKEIASELNISVETVRTHLKTAAEKLGGGTRWQKAIRAQELGLL